MAARRERTGRGGGLHRRPCRRGVLDAHDDAVRGSRRVDHRHARKSRARGLKEQRAARLIPGRNTIDEDGERRDCGGDFERHWIRLVVGGAQLEPRAIGRKQDVQPRRRGRSGAIARLKVPERRRQPGTRCHQHPVGGTRQRNRRRRQPGEGIEQDRRRRDAPDQTRHRRAVGPADPDADCALAVEADRPGITVAVAGPGLERDAAGDAILRRRRAEQHVADVPGGNGLHEPISLPLACPCAR